MAQNLAKSTTLVGSMTFISRILGFTRDMVVAYLFGVQAGYDAFLVAFKIPNFLRSLFAEGAFSQAFVPLLAEQQNGHELIQVKLFIDRVFTGLTLILVCLTIVGVLGASYVINVVAPGFEVGTERYQDASAMLKITFPYLLLISLTAFSGGILNSNKRFLAPAFTPVLLNVALISSAIFLSPILQQPIYALAWGVFAGGILQLLFQIPFLVRLGMLPRPNFKLQDPAVRKLLKLMLPAIFGASVVQLNLLLSNLFASFLPVGSISWLYYAERLMQFPLGVFGVALATVVLPHLSRRFAEKSEAQYQEALDWALRFALLIALPAGLGLYFLANPLLVTLFTYGAFGLEDVSMSAPALQTYAIGILPFVAIKVLGAAFYARQDIKTPVKIAVLALLTNALLCYLLIKPLLHIGLAMATVGAAIMQCMVLLAVLLKRGTFSFSWHWASYSIRVLLAGFLMSLFLMMVAGDAQSWAQLSWYWRLLQLLGAIASAVVIYFSSLWILGVRKQHLQAPALS